MPVVWGDSMVKERWFGCDREARSGCDCNLRKIGVRGAEIDVFDRVSVCDVFVSNS